ncbi:MAG TPA: diiron oxygenase [Jatrophihabitantaceae bacterium]|jgi:hypothetical protein|nr:diiron oxygenase [Jatrophihabitantaceae bacterium]
MTLRSGSDVRQKTAHRLLGSSAKNSYDPELDIDWDAGFVGEMACMPPQRTSLYGTAIWEAMTPEQRIALSKQEIASVASTGLWFEIILIQLLIRHVYHGDARTAPMQYALTEIGDETRHIIMFAKAVEAMGAPRYGPPRWIFHAARIYKALATGPLLFAPVLVAEETTDRLQRSTMHDASIHPMIRMVNRIHVVEEARHVRYAREEVSRLTPQLGRGRLACNQLLTALVSVAVIESLINPKVYAEVGLDQKAARRAARANPNYHETRRWMSEKVMAFLDEAGMVPRWVRPIYRRAHMI